MNFRDNRRRRTIKITATTPTTGTTAEGYGARDRLSKSHPLVVSLQSRLHNVAKRVAATLLKTGHTTMAAMVAAATTITLAAVAEVVAGGVATGGVREVREARGVRGSSRHGPAT